MFLELFRVINNYTDPTFKMIGFGAMVMYNDPKTKHMMVFLIFESGSQKLLFQYETE